MNKNPKKRFEVLLILFIISVFGLGCIGEALTNYNLKYNFDTGDIFVYNCTYLTEKTKDTVPIRIEMLISDFDGNNITSNVTSTKIIDGNNTESSYTTVMDVYGNLIRSDPENRIIPEIQPELPNLLKYPEKGMQEGQSWTVIFNRTINYNSSLTDELEGTKKYTSIGIKTVSTKAGKFKCVGIRSEVNFTANTKKEYENSTINLTTIGKISGEDWVDLEDGFLVKSEYNVDKILITDLSEVYKGIGIENYYLETPMKSHISSELENIRKE
ncbi:MULTISPECIES: hypothetical protein [Methanobacteriota]|jgi:hypothetical protein|uniref:Uncharacterized protein n=6 Tax=Methanosarcina mazei TaxID=2209 RepID=A0A0F8HPR8_METMZ|nr:hypothetical protein [Methanosarcina mazei]AKB41117.1 hypothetical protein MSMAW_2126 [Methanosarcina mazei WWM610]AKB69394.1 hypothetical protein MSMAL_2851 [Methanosarcina mazei LYC]AKB72090.1 hypothetical protein MSMAC_2200 [Methanosarcina mazei C16]KKF99530.1 hypothetical protein DU40_00810 [Methanosarcina mazei]KKG02407.1 hypothetical protein DU31_04935 [Methanosarcina mazei]